MPGVVAPSTLITQIGPQSAMAEAYRQLRTNIQFASLDKPLRTLLVTSAGPGEGKSTTLANLAITIAQNGSAVTLVDCDLRRPSLHELFGLSNGHGLTNLVAESASLETHLQETGVPNLRLLPSGPLPPSPSELLGSRRMMEVIQQLQAVSDYVLFDTPPIVAVTDAAVLATRVDGVLLVIRAGKTRRELARKAKSILEKVNAPLVGVVLNNVALDGGIEHYYAREGASR